MQPKCRLCGHAHWSNEPHVMPDLPVNSVVSHQPQAKLVVNKQAVVVNRTQDRHKDKENRKIYMREYMHKRRQGL